MNFKVQRSPARIVLAYRSLLRNADLFLTGRRFVARLPVDRNLLLSTRTCPETCYDEAPREFLGKRDSKIRAMNMIARYETTQISIKYASR